MGSGSYRTVAAVVSAALALAGCATHVSYAPRPTHPAQTVSAERGVGTLSERDANGALHLAPTFRRQTSTEPVFTIAYANTSDHAVAFGPAQVRASFRGAPVALVTREEKAAQRSVGDVAGEVAVVLLGAVAVVAALYGLSQPVVALQDTGVGRVRVVGVDDGFVTAVVAGSLADAGLQQLDDTAQTRAAAAAAILIRRLVSPQQLATGQLMLKGCCERALREGDVVRFDVDVDGRAHAFEFLRTAPGDWSAMPEAAAPLAAPVPLSAKPRGPRSPLPRLAGGQDAFAAGRLARGRACHPEPDPALTDKGPGYETYGLVCADGTVLSIRCEFGNCRAAP